MASAPPDNASASPPSVPDGEDAIEAPPPALHSANDGAASSSAEFARWDAFTDWVISTWAISSASNYACAWTAVPVSRHVHLRCTETKVQRVATTWFGHRHEGPK